MNEFQEFYAQVVRFTHMDNKIDDKCDYNWDFTVQEKFDGSHACIYKNLNETIYASRNLVLDKEEGNNFMFRFKEMAIKDAGIQKYINSNPTHILYGEYMRDESKFYVFDIGKVVTKDGKENKKISQVEMFYFPQMEQALEEHKISYIPTKSFSKGLFQEEQVKWKNHPKDSVEGAVFKFYKNGEMLKVLKVLNNNYFRNVPITEAKVTPEVALWNTRKNVISSCLQNMISDKDSKIYIKDLIDRITEDLMEDVKDGSVEPGNFKKFASRKVMEIYKDKEIRENIFGNVQLYSKKGEAQVLL
jgi:hypothetical protein